jgi:hypothetical protein
VKAFRPSFDERPVEACLLIGLVADRVGDGLVVSGLVCEGLNEGRIGSEAGASRSGVACKGFAAARRFDIMSSMTWVWRRVLVRRWKRTSC